jgi:hypothetical protein
MQRTEMIALLVSAGLLTLVFELVRRKNLKEKYSLLWLFTAIILLILSVSRGALNQLAALMGIYYSPSAFFLLAFFFLMLITLQFSVVISKLSERNKTLSQEVALLKLRLGELESEIRG